MPLGQCCAQRFGDVLRLVIDRRVEAELVDDVTAFFGAAGDPDDAATFDLRDLPDDHADGAGRPRHHDRLAGLGLADVEQAEVGGYSRHAEPADVHRQRDRACIDLGELTAVDERVLLDIQNSGDVVAGGKVRVAAFHHASGAGRAHHLADADRRNVRAAFVHPAAHRGIEREVQDLHEHLAFARLGNGLGRELPVAAFRHPDGTGGKPELPVGRGGWHSRPWFPRIRERPLGSTLSRTDQPLTRDCTPAAEPGRSA